MTHPGIGRHREPDCQAAPNQRGGDAAERLGQVGLELGVVDARGAIEADRHMTVGLADGIGHRAPPIEDDAAETEMLAGPHAEQGRGRPSRRRH